VSQPERRITFLRVGESHKPYREQRPRFCRPFLRVSEGTRTPDRLDHNQELYQLSYTHHGS
jgi:hypothetical protein